MPSFHCRTPARGYGYLRLSHNPALRTNICSGAGSFNARNNIPHMCRGDSICHQARVWFLPVNHSCPADRFPRQVWLRRWHHLYATVCTRPLSHSARHKSMLKMPGVYSIKKSISYSYFILFPHSSSDRYRISLLFSHFQPRPASAVQRASLMVILPLTGLPLTGAVLLRSIRIKHPVPCASC